jgi:hypothetical protein
MDLKTEKLHLIEWLVALKDKSIIEDLVKWKEERQRISIEQYNKELDDANTRIEAGDFASHEDVVKESASWLK